jgi:hypothetical protein
MIESKRVCCPREEGEEKDASKVAVVDQNVVDVSVLVHGEEGMMMAKEVSCHCLMVQVMMIAIIPLSA